VVDEVAGKIGHAPAPTRGTDRAALARVPDQPLEAAVGAGGLAARDLEAFAVGLEEALDERYLEYRVAVSRYMAEGLEARGVPVMQPPGGHAVYLDARGFLPHLAPTALPGQALACELYLALGVRGCEIGTVMFGKRDPAGALVPAAMDLVRLAFPRRVYTQAHFDYILEGVEDVVAHKGALRGLRIVEEPPFLRHFTARFAPLE
jgi:tryptophanase